MAPAPIQLTPLLSLLLIHDFLLSKNGIAAPTGHPLRQAVERHKARLNAEFTKARLRRKCATVEELKLHLRNEKPRSLSSTQFRWVRINLLKTSWEGQLESTFRSYEKVKNLDDLRDARPGDDLYYIDFNVPNLLALPLEHDLSRTSAYQAGDIILQDKASCFPAHLLLGECAGEASDPGDVLDACAAPGNKTSHAAAICAERRSKSLGGTSTIFACERDLARSATLKTMMKKAGADKVTILANQDFLDLDPAHQSFRRVTHILLDPSCSGSGILNREDIPTLNLPTRGKKPQDSTASKSSRKRKRSTKPEEMSNPNSEDQLLPLDAESEETLKNVDSDRLTRLSNLQTRLLLHAFTFPAVRRITYSTCSVHHIENERVVACALSSSVARNKGWGLHRRRDQVTGLKEWPHRGEPDATPSEGTTSSTSSALRTLSEEELQACIRCNPGSEDGTMGFFVCAFVRASGPAPTRNSAADGVAFGEEWEGFSDR